MCSECKTLCIVSAVAVYLRLKGEVPQGSRHVRHHDALQRGAGALQQGGLRAGNDAQLGSPALRRAHRAGESR